MLRSLQPDKWQRSQTDEELDGALEAIDDAAADFDKSTRRLENLRPLEAGRRSSSANKGDTSADDPVIWFKRGLAFTLPLIATLALGLIIARILF